MYGVHGRAKLVAGAGAEKEFGLTGNSLSQYQLFHTDVIGFDHVVFKSFRVKTLPCSIAQA